MKESLKINCIFHNEEQSAKYTYKWNNDVSLLSAKWLVIKPWCRNSQSEGKCKALSSQDL